VAVPDQSGTLRLFFALTPVATQSAALAERVAPLIAQLHAQRVPPENFHATLCFLGAVAPERLAPLKEMAAGIRGTSATLHFDALDHWPKPGVLCATAPDNSLLDPLRALAQRLAADSTAAGFSSDVKPFRAHLTVARKVQRVAAAECDWPLPLAPPFVVDCDRFMLMSSRRGESGSIYSVVESWPLYA
jgi:RNA 2',3'-cyclic 3'-phosphodiesterase